MSAAQRLRAIRGFAQLTLQSGQAREMLLNALCNQKTSTFIPPLANCLCPSSSTPDPTMQGFWADSGSRRCVRYRYAKVY
ncbi:MAG: hypothetical protein WA919_08745 [Coleofasciculaceae cyanobacterium]